MVFKVLQPGYNSQKVPEKGLGIEEVFINEEVICTSLCKKHLYKDKNDLFLFIFLKFIFIIERSVLQRLRMQQTS